MYISEINGSSDYIMQLPLQPALHKQWGFAAFVALQGWQSCYNDKIWKVLFHYSHL